jgi:hypothetical protein
MLPLATVETRWFFAGPSQRHPELHHWFETCRPFSASGDLTKPEWRGRVGGEPDVYLLMTGCTDMGVKWREGTLQIKGRVADLGARRFSGRHQGRVQRWIKWTYPEVPAAYRALFDDAGNAGLETASVHKTRALRMISLDSAEPAEVSPGIVLEHGVGVEMTDLELRGERFCSIAFEAFPDDAVSVAGFDSVVAGFLDELGQSLSADASLSYPEWLARYA